MAHCGDYERFADMIDRHWDGIAVYCEAKPKSRSASSKASTTKPEPSSDALRACATKNIVASRFLHACFRRYDPSKSPTRFPEDQVL
jgi:hypothetical protein